MAKAVFFDMDNTLIETQQLYAEAENNLADFLLSCGVHAAPQAINDYLMQRQLALFDTYAYGKEMLPQAYEQTLRHFVPDATAAERQHARDIAYGVYASEAKIKPHVHAALQSLAAAGFDLYLITVGDLDVQKNRVEALPFKNMFRQVFVVSDKNAAAYADALGRAGLRGEDAIMVGDSLKSDILPARQNGMQAIHVPADNWHGREMAGQSLPEGARMQPDILAAASDILRTAAAPSGAQVKRRAGRGFGPR